MLESRDSAEESWQALASSLTSEVLPLRGPPTTVINTSSSAAESLSLRAALLDHRYGFICAETVGWRLARARNRETRSEPPTGDLFEEVVLPLAMGAPLDLALGLLGAAAS